MPLQCGTLLIFQIHHCCGNLKLCKKRISKPEPSMKSAHDETIKLPLPPVKLGSFENKFQNLFAYVGIGLFYKNFHIFLSEEKMKGKSHLTSQQLHLQLKFSARLKYMYNLISSILLFW